MDVPKLVFRSRQAGRQSGERKARRFVGGAKPRVSKNRYQILEGLVGFGAGETLRRWSNRGGFLGAGASGFPMAVVGDGEVGRRCC